MEIVLDILTTHYYIGVISVILSLYLGYYSLEALLIIGNVITNKKLAYMTLGVLFVYSLFYYWEPREQMEDLNLISSTIFIKDSEE